MSIEDHHRRAEQIRTKEAEVRAICRVGDLQLAAEKTLRLYGNEIMGWLVRRYRSPQMAAEMFSNFSFYFWRYFPDFRWNSNLRTWVYSIARKVCYVKLPRQQDPLSDLPANLSALVAEGQARISTYKFPGVEDAYHELCRSVLTDPEQDILVWRINAGMKWKDIALILADESIQGEDELRRRAGQLRKRFERIKKKLREGAEERGMIRLPQ